MSTTSKQVVDLTALLQARSYGHDLIEDPSIIGGIFVDDDVIRIAADIENVAKIGFGGDIKAVCAVMLQVMRRTLVTDEDGNTEDPFDAARDWLDGWLENDSEVLSA